MKHCPKCGRPVRERIGRFEFNPDTGRPQYWRYAACERVSLHASSRFVRRALGSVIGGEDGHFAKLLARVERPRRGCAPGCVAVMVSLWALSLTVVGVGFRSRGR